VDKYTHHKLSPQLALLMSFSVEGQGVSWHREQIVFASLEAKIKTN